MKRINISFVLNGVAVSDFVEPRTSLADYLRHGCQLTGTHVGCEQGVCGMCTVLFDDKAIKSCLMLAPQIEGHSITTVESVSEGDRLHPLQRLFNENHALQCGYCTPAFLMTALALCNSDEIYDVMTLRDELAGVLCRCTGYQKIIETVAQFLDYSNREKDSA